ncbi:MAG: ABC transporter substrate-binding protein [Sphingobium sp.]
MKRALLAAPLGLALIGLSGCGSPADDLADRFARERATGSGWTLEVAVGQDGPTMDPAYATNERGMTALRNSYAFPMSYALLPARGDVIARDPHHPVGEVLETLTGNADATIWTARVRRDATFADGTPVTAQALAHMMQRNLALTDSGGPFIMRTVAHLSAPGAIRVVDERSLIFTLDAPLPSFPQVMALSAMALINPRQAGATKDDPWGKRWLNRHAAASGPYSVAEWVPGNRVVLARNPHYAPHPDRPDHVVERIVPSSANRMILLKRGVVDVALELSPDDFVELRQERGIRTIAVPNTRQLSLTMNTRIAPFSDRRVRQAISLALPYRTIVEKVYRGLAQPGGGPIPIGFPGHPEGRSAFPTQDMARARQLLAAARLPDDLMLTLEVTNDPVSSRTAIFVQQAMTDLGLDVRIRRLAPNVFAEKRAKRHMALFINSSGYSLVDPSYATQVGYACKGFFNFGEYCNPSVDAKIKAAAMERDPARRASLYARIQADIEADAPIAWLAQPHFLIASRSGVSGYSDFGDRLVRYQYFRRAD